MVLSLNTVDSRLADTSLVRTPLHCGQEPAPGETLIATANYVWEWETDKPALCSGFLDKN